MILPFNKQFKAPILSGEKRHTIRLDKTDRWKAGNSIQMATGVRSKNYNCFKEAVCISTQKIEIKHDGPCVWITVDGEELPITSLQRLAKYDGFESIPDFLKWFNKDFTGKIIHWTDLQY